MSAIIASPRVQLARTVAKDLLVGREDRWRHTIGVASRAAELVGTVPSDDRELLVAAAWLHDIGYADALVRTGFHSLDGATHLAETGWEVRLAALVAHHSGADFIAAINGCGPALSRYPHETSPVADALTYADQTTGPLGQRVDVRSRIAEVVRRHGPQSVQARAYPVRGPYILALAERVEARMAVLLSR